MRRAGVGVQREVMTPLRVLVRSGFLIGILLLGDLAGYLWKTVGANIGLGLLVFLVLGVVAGALGLLDGRRHAIRGVLVMWLVVSAVVGLFAAASVSVGAWLLGGGFTMSVLASDLVLLAPFMACLVAVPALIGAALGEATSAGRVARAPRPTT